MLSILFQYDIEFDTPNNSNSYPIDYAIDYVKTKLVYYLVSIMKKCSESHRYIKYFAAYPLLLVLVTHLKQNFENKIIALLTCPQIMELYSIAIYDDSSRNHLFEIHPFLMQITYSQETMQTLLTGFTFTSNVHPTEWLHTAASLGFIGILEFCASQGQDLRIEVNGLSLVYAAAKANQVEILDLLINKLQLFSGTEKTNFGLSPLHTAAINHSLPAMEF